MFRNQESKIHSRCLKSILIAACFLTVLPSMSQENKITQTAGVDNTRMGAYRALAQLSWKAFQNGDRATAAELARILERTWDQGEWHNASDGSYCKANRPLCQPIDHALDVFIGPIVDNSQSTPDPAAVKAAYQDFLEKLQKAD